MSEEASSHARTRTTRSFPQRRAHLTHGKLLDAARAVFAEKGFDDTGTPDIARRAGVSVGTFYRYFADKRQAFLEMMAAYLRTTYERVMENLDPEVFSAGRSHADRRRAVDHVLDVLFRSARESPRLNRVFLAMSLRDPDAARLRAEFEELGRTSLAALLEQVVPGELPDARASAEVIQVAAREVALATAGTARPRRDVLALRAALADMIYRYVFSRGPRGPA